MGLSTAARVAATSVLNTLAIEFIRLKDLVVLNAMRHLVLICMDAMQCSGVEIIILCTGYASIGM